MESEAVEIPPFGLQEIADEVDVVHGLNFGRLHGVFEAIDVCEEKLMGIWKGPFSMRAPLSQAQ